MSEILFVTEQLPSFTPPLERSAGIAQELISFRSLGVAYFTPPELPLETTPGVPDFIRNALKLSPSPRRLYLLGESRALKDPSLQSLFAEPPAIIQAENSGVARALKPVLSRLRNARLFTFLPQAVETAGQKFVLGPGLDSNYYRRSGPVNVTSKQVLFRIESSDNSGREEEINREAVEFVIRQVWPLVLLKHPEAFLMISAGEMSRNFLGQERTGEGWALSYGRIDLTDYEKSRLALAPYLTTAPGNAAPMLKALAMQLPLLTLPAAARFLVGLGAKLGDHFLKGEDAPSLAALIARLFEIRGPGLHLARAGRSLVEERFGWQAQAQRLDQFYARFYPSPTPG